MLQKCGADANLKNNTSTTALQLACGNCNDECAKLLLQHGVNVNNVNNRNEAVLHVAMGMTNEYHYCLKAVSPILTQ